MKNLHYLTLTLTIWATLLFASCAEKQDDNNEIKELEFKFVKDIELPKPANFANYYRDFQFKNDNGQETVWVYYSKKKIIGYDLKTQKQIASIPLKDPYLFSFNYINKDSILIYLNPAIDPEFLHDSILYLINDKGEPLKYFTLEKTPALCARNKTEDPDSVFYSYLSFQRQKYNDNKAFLLFGKYNYAYIGDDKFTSYDHPIAGHIDFKTGEYHPHTGINYIYIKEGVYYPKTYHNVYVELSEKGNPIYAFSYTPDLLEYDLKTNKAILHDVKSILLDTIKPANEPIEEAKKFNKPNFGRLHFNKNTNQYFRFVNYPNAYNLDFGYAVMLLDKNFKPIAEGFCPNEISTFNMFFRGDKLVTFNYYKTIESDDKIILSEYEISTRKANPAELLERTKPVAKKPKTDSDFVNFLQKTTKIKKSKEAFVTLPYLYCCPSCANYTVKLFSKNKKLLSDKNVCLIVSGKNKAIILEALKKENLAPDGKYVFYDSKEEYNEYDNRDYLNPRFTIIEDNKILKDTVYPPANIEDLKADITKFIEELKK